MYNTWNDKKNNNNIKDSREGGGVSERGVRDFGADSMEHIRAIQVVIISANCWGSNLIHPHKKLGGERDREKES